MSIKVIEIKVSFTCEKNKTDVLKVIAKLIGVNSITVNDEKGTVTIVGTVDPVCVVTQLRKGKICAEIVTVGPPKKPEVKKPEECKPHSCSCQQCMIFPVVPYDIPYNKPPGCWLW